MVAQYEIRDKVFEFVEIAAMSFMKSFYPTAVAKYVNTSVQNIFPYLLDLVESEELQLKWEIRCPNFYCHQNIKEIDSISDSNSDELSCPKCGYEFELSEKDIFPRFDLNPKYKEYIKRKNEEKKSLKKKQPLLLRL